jgi:hypothetical protein
MPLPLVASGIALADALVRMFAPVNRLIDEFQISDEGRARAKAEMTAFQNDALALALAVEKDRLAAQASMLVAEAGGQSWLQRNWRPITMLSFLGLVVADSFGLLAFRLADQAWLLLQIGLGGYVVGRSFEKISPQTNGAIHQSLHNIASPAPEKTRRNTAKNTGKGKLVKDVK